MNQASRNSGQQERKATILQVLPALGQSGGVERGTVDMAAGIVDAGGKALVASQGGDRLYDLIRQGGKHFILPLVRRSPWAIYANAKRLATLIEKERVDLVHARSRAPAWSALLACRWTNTPFVTTFHGTYGATNPLKRAYNKVMTRGLRVIAISRFIAEHMHRIYGTPKSRIRLVCRGVDLQVFNPVNVSQERVIKLANQWRLPDGQQVVMLPGRLTRWKGQEVLIEAIAKLERRDIRCLLIGSAQGRERYRQRLLTLVERHGLSSVVHLVDDCRDMAAAYMLADVVVSASIEPEAFGRVAAEAQAMGRPVIATNHGGAREVVIDGETGWLVRPNDATALADYLTLSLSLSTEERTAISQRSCVHIAENFSKDSMVVQTLEVYNEVLSLGTGQAS